MILSTYSGLIWFLQKKTLFYIYIFISIWTFEIEQFRIWSAIRNLSNRGFVRRRNSRHGNIRHWNQSWAVTVWMARMPYVFQNLYEYGSVDVDAIVSFSSLQTTSSQHNHVLYGFSSFNLFMEKCSSSYKYDFLLSNHMKWWSSYKNTTLWKFIPNKRVAILGVSSSKKLLDNCASKWRYQIEFLRYWHRVYFSLNEFDSRFELSDPKKHRK